jgi:hypothetical protein
VPRLSPTCPRGQATPEYVAVLLVVVLVLGGAVTAAKAITGVDLARPVVATIKTGICIVGGDICRDVDAKALGLAPCVTNEGVRGGGAKMTVAVVSFGSSREWTVALRSDGSTVVTLREDTSPGATAGVGVDFSPLEVSASADLALELRYRAGRAWTFPDLARAKAFLAANRDAREHPPAAVSWHGAGARADASAKASVAGLLDVGLGAAAAATVGVRSAGARRTYTLDHVVDDPTWFAEALGYPLAGDAGSSSGAAVEYTTEHGTARELVLRSTTVRDGRTVEQTAQLDLRDPANATAARGLLTSLAPGGPGPRAALADVVGRLHRTGTVERDVYAVDDDGSSFAAAGKLGLELGFSTEDVHVDRWLVSATTSVRGGPLQTRVDCLQAVAADPVV